MSHFSELFDKYMIEKGYANSWVAWKTGLSRQTIIRWRQEIIKKPTCEKVFKVMKVLQLTSQQQQEFLQVAGCEREKPTEHLLPIVCNPIHSPNQLFGREDVLENIRRFWLQIPIINMALVGPRASGKTSLLHYLERVATATNLRLDQPKGWKDWLPHHFQFAIINFHDPGICEPDILVSEVLQQLKLPIPPRCDLHSFAETLKQINQPTIIMMDEIGAGLNSKTLTKEFWHNLRFLTGRCAYLGYLVTAHEPLWKLAQDAGKSSPFFNMFGNYLELGAFTKDEAIELLSYLPQDIPQEDKEWMLENSRRWPVLLQILCDERLMAIKQNKPETIWKSNALKRIEEFQHLP
jgi:hypothetical protein